MNSDILKYVLIVALSVFGIMKNSVSLNPIRFHCDNYILNNYLYIILSWGIVLTTVATLYNKNVALSSLFTGPFTILLSVGSIMLLVGLLFIPPSYFFTKHIMFIFQIILMGLIIYPLYVKNVPLFKQVALSTLFIMVALSMVVYLKPDIIKQNIGIYLLIALFSLLIGRLVEMFLVIKNKKPYNNYSRILSYIAVALFSIFIMYDTKRLIVGAQNCVNPDYINNSLNLFLDSINMFTNMYHLRDN